MVKIENKKNYYNTYDYIPLRKILKFFKVKVGFFERFELRDESDYIVIFNKKRYIKIHEEAFYRFLKANGYSDYRYQYAFNLNILGVKRKYRKFKEFK